MEYIVTVSDKIRKAFPKITELQAERLARLVVSITDNYDEAIELARVIPRCRYGTFRLDCAEKKWIMIEDRPSYLIMRDGPRHAGYGGMY